MGEKTKIRLKVVAAKINFCLTNEQFFDIIIIVGGRRKMPSSERYEVFALYTGKDPDFPFIAVAAGSSGETALEKALLDYAWTMRTCIVRIRQTGNGLWNAVFECGTFRIEKLGEVASPESLLKQMRLMFRASGTAPRRMERTERCDGCTGLKYPSEMQYVTFKGGTLTFHLCLGCMEDIEEQRHRRWVEENYGMQAYRDSSPFLTTE